MMGPSAPGRCSGCWSHILSLSIHLVYDVYFFVALVVVLCVVSVVAQLFQHVVCVDISMSSVSVLRMSYVCV